MRWNIFFLPMYWLPNAISAKIHNTTVGFHLINLSSCKSKVAPPNNNTTPSVIRCIFSKRLYISQKTVICIKLATIKTAVAVYIPDAELPVTLKAIKNARIGKKSNKNFMKVIYAILIKLMAQSYRKNIARTIYDTVF